MPIHTRDEFISFIERRAIEKWERSNAPYMLSSIGTEMSVNGDDYRPIIAPLKLRQFVLGADFSRVKAIAHPHHGAAVAIVPKEADFAFPEEGAPAEQPSADGDQVQSQGRTPKFSPAVRLLGILSKLTPDELARVQIPVDVLVKLHNAK